MVQDLLHKNGLGRQWHVGEVARQWAVEVDFSLVGKPIHAQRPKRFTDRAELKQVRGIHRNPAIHIGPSEGLHSGKPLGVHETKGHPRRPGCGKILLGIEDELVQTGAYA
jgi:hypothetical protein